MNRRDVLSAIGSLIAFPSVVFGLCSKKPEQKTDNKWWYEKEFEFEGHIVVYYKMPFDRAVWLTPVAGCTDNNVIVPFFDIRQFGGSIEQNLREAIRSACYEYKETANFVHIIQYEGNQQIAIVCNATKLFPQTCFKPEDCVERYEKHTRRINGQTTTGRWDEPVKHDKLTEEQILDKIAEFRKGIESKNNLIDDMKNFLKNQGVA